MKKFLVIIFLLFNGLVAIGQNLAEWLHQKKTQIKYLEQQIGALQVYDISLSKGFRIARKGLSDIDALARGDFKTHDNYFSSLEKVNPVLKSYSKVAEISTIENTILSGCTSQQRHMKESKCFTSAELSYCAKVYGRLLERCAGILQQLYDVTTVGYFTMSDDARLEQIDRLYDQMNECDLFFRHFNNETRMLALQRIREEAAVKNLRALW